jgi:adenylate cyclase
MTEELTACDLSSADKTIMFADIADYTRLMQGDERTVARRLLKLLLGAAADLVPSHGGTLIERPGDALFVAFDDPRQAVRCALELHRRAEVLAAAEPDEPPLRFHIGIHSAAVLSDGRKLYGHGVNTAARLTGVAGPGETVISAEARQALRRLAEHAGGGETLVSAAIRDHLTHALDADVEDLGVLPANDAPRQSADAVPLESLGEVQLKHIDEPVRAYRVGTPGPQPVVPSGTATLHELRPAIAVLPFSPYADEPTRIGLGDVVSDQLIAALSHSSSVRVISRLSSQAFRGRAAAVGEVGRVLGAAFVVSGRYWNDSRHLQLNLELADPRTGQVEWADLLTGTVADALSTGSDLIQRAVAGVINAVVRAELRAARGMAMPNVRSHALYLAATLLMHRFTRADFMRAHDMLDALCERAPRHPHPRAWLARWHVFRVVQGWSPDVERDRRDALGHAHRALDLDPESSLALTIAGSVHTNMLKDLDGAEMLYQQALEANPNEALAWILRGTARAFQGRGAEALDSCERGIALTPIDPMRCFYDNLAAAAAIAAGDYPLALKYAQASVRANRLHTSSLRTLAICQSILGMRAAARSTMADLLRLEPELTAETYLARLPFADRALADRLVAALVDAGLPRAGRADH